jgi:hypothetical protein
MGVETRDQVHRSKVMKYDSEKHDTVARGTLAWACAKMIEEPGRENGKNVGKARWNSSGYFEHWSPQDCEPGPTEWLHDGYIFSGNDCRSSSWHPVAPEPGSREAVAASAEGTCWWHQGKDAYFRKQGSNLLRIRTLDGVHVGTFGVDIDGTLAPILDANGQPSEPVVGSQLWAQVCCRELGKRVRRVTYARDRWTEWRSGKFWYCGTDYDGHECRELGVNHPVYESDWSLYEPPAEQPAPDPIAEIKAELAALTAKVERLEEGKS